MKAKLVIIIGCLSMLISSYAFAACCTPRPSNCRPAEYPCACTDPGWQYNNCMSKEKYCEAFGNDGYFDRLGV